MDTTTPMMQQLKAATRSAHEALEAQVNLVRLATSSSAYQALLQRFYGFYLPLELRLATLPWTTVAFDLAARRKTPLLRRDLVHLGNTITKLDGLPSVAIGRSRSIWQRVAVVSMCWKGPRWAAS